MVMFVRTNFVWPARPLISQDRARRNARLAAIECAQRRVEREEVEIFLERHRGGSL